MKGLRIGELAAQTGFNAPTIRYYESIGLLKAPARAASGYRTYSERSVKELTFIRKAQAFGFELEEIAEILTLSRSGRQPCGRVLSMARRHLEVVDDRLRQLQEFRNHLATAVARWEAKNTAVTEDGLCCFIATTQPAGDASPETATPHVRSRRKGQ